MNADHPAPDAAAMPAPQPLPGQGVLEVTGADAERFLQGQLTNDLRLLTPESLLLAGYQTPQGRVLAVLRVVRAAEGFLILLPRGLAGELATRLARYTLRAKVRVEDASERYAASGTLDAAFARLCEAYGATPAAGQRHLRLGSTSLVDRGHGRSLVLCSQGEAPAVAAEPRGGLRWMQAGIRAGDPEDQWCHGVTTHASPATLSLAQFAAAVALSALPLARSR